ILVPEARKDERLLVREARRGRALLGFLATTGFCVRVSEKPPRLWIARHVDVGREEDGEAGHAMTLTNAAVPRIVLHTRRSSRSLTTSPTRACTVGYIFEPIRS